MLRPNVLATALTALLFPALALAQGSITGTVRDSSGAVLPGVTVEAASPVLIEKVRSVTSDATGQYRIVDLRPGTYAVTFALPRSVMPASSAVEGHTKTRSPVVAPLSVNVAVS